MNGARNYAKLFKTGQYGKLYITSGSHARGYTFRIQVLPDGEKAIPNGSQNTCINNNAVEVYGVVSGNQGWTESYDWLHKGQWCEDFQKLVDEREKEIEAENNRTDELKKQIETERQQKVDALLKSY